jgi:Domain of unknown function (DUF4189)
MNTRAHLHAWIGTLGLLMAVTAAAEGGCPPGQYPQQGQGWQTCVPIPGYSQSNNAPPPPAERWDDRWGALAADSSARIAGSSSDQPTEEQAVAAAIADCKAYGATGCRQSAVYRNQCIAVVSGDKLSRTYSAKTESSAVSKGMSECDSEGQSACHVFYSGCSLPVRVQ